MLHGRNSQPFALVGDTHSPASLRHGESGLIAFFAVALRVVVFAAAMRIGHLSLAQYTAKGDTSSYMANAAAMCGERSLTSLDEYDVRVFPGYPALIAVVHRTGVSLPMSALWVTWISAGIAAGAAARAFDDARVGWATTCLIPHYVINSSLGMSEAPLLAAVCLALLAFKKNRLILAGALIAFAGMIRPMACFAFAGILLATVTPALQRSTRPASHMVKSILSLSASTAVIFAIELIAFQLWTGNAFRGIHVYSQNPGAYGGHLLALPFHSLLTTPGIDHAGLGRIVYIWIHVAITLTACVMVFRRVFQPGNGSRNDLISFPWLIGNTVFVLCIGSVWGFRHFPRFTIPAAPPLFWTLRNWLPRRAGWWIAIATACGAMAVGGVIHSP